MSTSGCWPAGAGSDGCCARLSSASRQCARAASRLAGDAVMKALLVASHSTTSATGIVRPNGNAAVSPGPKADPSGRITA